jgi:ribulokinase
MDKNCFMGIDLGTQSVRCGVADCSGALLALGEKKYNIFHPAPGYAEQDPAEILSSLECAVRDCRREAGDDIFGRIAGIAVCATSSTIVAADDGGSPLMNAILWMDNRASAQAAAIGRTSHEVLRHCGGEESVEWLVPKMMWIRDNRPDIFAKSRRVVEMQDYINHYLTGNWAASVCQAVCKANYVEERGGFDEGFFEAIGLPEFFDKADLNVLTQGEPVGELRNDLAVKFGIRPGTLVYQGGVDAHVCGIGLGVCRPGDIGVVMGSSFVQLALTEDARFFGGVWGPYKSAVVPGLYCLEGGQVSAASITKWFIREFGVAGENPYSVMAAEAGAVSPGSDGLVLLDFFQGNRTPHKDASAKGVFFGLTLAHTRAHMYRAVLEGIAFGMRSILDAMENGQDVISKLSACGGVTNNKVWLRIISDVINKPTVLTENSGNAGVLGGAIIAAVGSGRFANFQDACDSMVNVTEVITPDEKSRERYEAPYGKYLDLYRNLKGLF